MEKWEKFPEKISMYIFICPKCGDNKTKTVGLSDIAGNAFFTRGCECGHTWKVTTESKT